MSIWHDRGFTLVELLVTIAVLAIIASLAAPSLSTILANQRASRSASDISGMLQEARGQAVMLRQPVDLIYQQVLISGSSPAAFDQQWQLETGVLGSAPSRTVIRTWVLERKSVVSSNWTSAFTVAGNAHQGIRFLPNGAIGLRSEDLDTLTNSQIPPQIVFRICDSGVSGEAGQTVILFQSGAQRVYKGVSTDSGMPSEETTACA